MFLLFLSMMLFASCHTGKKTAGSTAPQGQEAVTATVTGAPNESQVAVASPRVIIYKMKKDYSQNVPVILSADKKTIVSYPHPRDVYTNGKLAFPTPLKDGYWLDNRGIGENVAFLSYTYEEYAALSEAPDLSLLYKKIIDKDPITEMWNCGRRHNYHDLINDLNEIIVNNKMEGNFKRVK